ncbi:MAG: fasciclin domain-containing protein [Planctomycetota bacterium]
MLQTLCALTLAATATAPAPNAIHDNQSRPSIVETALGADDLSTLVTALKAADLVGALQGDGPFTVFAPTNEAFAALPHGVLESLLEPENVHRLKSILTYHVAPGAFDAQAVSSQPRIATLEGQSVTVRLEDGAPIVDGASVVAADVLCSNGVVHLIDRVLLPNEQNIAQLAQGAGTFETLLAAAQRAGLVPALTGEGPLTVFAPTDEAFAELPDGALEKLLEPENYDRLGAILKYHVVQGRVFADQAAAARTAVTLQGESVRAAIRGGRLTIDGATVVTNDLQASNGVVHVIDRVLMPEELPPSRRIGRLLIGIYPGDVSAALAKQLGIDPKRAILVDRLTEGGNAEKYGVQRFDVIVEIDGRPAVEGELDRAKARAGFNNPVALTLIRGGKRLTVEVPVGAERH